MGLSYTFSLLAMSFIRQLLGTGVLSLSNPMTNAEIFALRLIPEGFEIGIFKQQTGAFLTFAVLAAAVTAGSPEKGSGHLILSIQQQAVNPS